MPDRDPNRDAQRGVVAEGEAGTGGEEEVERDIRARLRDLVGVLPPEEEDVVGPARIGITHADVERELRTGREPLSPLEEDARPRIPRVGDPEVELAGGERGGLEGWIRPGLCLAITRSQAYGDGDSGSGGDEAREAAVPAAGAALRHPRGVGSLHV